MAALPAALLVGAKFEDSSLRVRAWVHTGREVIDVTFENTAFAALVRIG
jgi:hypothetical protein